MLPAGSTPFFVVKTGLDSKRDSGRSGWYAHGLKKLAMATVIRTRLPRRLPARSLCWLLALGVGGVCPCLRAQSGRLDTSFDPGSGVNEGSQVYATALQPDGRTLIVGDFTNFNGTGRTNIARLNYDGTLDRSFDPGSAVGASVYVGALAVQADGRVLVAGNFLGSEGTNLVRLNTNGTVDSAFSAATDSTVNSLVVQTNGRVVIGGFFTQVNGATRAGIARLGTNGVLDATFNPSLTGGFPSPSINALAMQADGKILIAGSFTNVNGTLTTNLARLNSNGSVDTNFHALSFGPPGAVLLYTVAADPQGRVLVGGSFDSCNSLIRSNLIRLNADGTMDTNFNAAAGTDATVYFVAAQSDGKALIGGSFTAVNGVARNAIARLNSDGSLDGGFDPGAGANGVVWSVASQPNGKVLIGGSFTEFDNTLRAGIARLLNPPELVNPAVSNGLFQVSVQTQLGAAYFLEFKDLLADPDWSVLPAVAGDGTVKALVDTNAVGAQRFYRLQVQ